MREEFARLPDGSVVERVTLSGGGLMARVLTFGSVIQDLRLAGHAPPLVLGFESFASYLEHSPYFGATPGRVANRLAEGRFTLDGRAYQLECNEGGVTHLHGGSDGLAVRNWSIIDLAGDRVVMEVRDPDGRAGYPGTVTARVTYHLQPEGVLAVRYEATADQPTPVNLCQHSYFNLDGTADILDHELEVAAETYLPVNERLIPHGHAAPVAGTAFDFRVSRPIRTEDQGVQVPFDHNFCLSSSRVAKRPVGKVASPLSGVSMTVATTEPGVQFYAGVYLDVPVAGLEGRRYGPYAGLCLETQIWPDAINQTGFPEAVLRPGEVLVQETDYIFTKS
ncbi:aldose epimerase family protein [Rhizobium paknamense]|uniref:Aldose 1-epimerase n=1 Tax=Rhizobium paknamense TaxID=1206817 RepID=A0ABU0IGS2_9HYPH|nr:aldose epimerase family protein [Rhizobium paknamense]MDQ0457361.1 aldose 1-epimerase [Rhizobium paknamense]